MSWEALLPKVFDALAGPVMNWIEGPRGTISAIAVAPSLSGKAGSVLDRHVAVHIQAWPRLHRDVYVQEWRVLLKPEEQLDIIPVGSCWIERPVIIPGLQTKYSSQEVRLNPLPNTIGPDADGWLRLIIHANKVDHVRKLKVQAKIRGRWKNVCEAKKPFDHTDRLYF